MDWPKHYSTQDVLLEYFRDCAVEYGVRDHIRFRTEVVAATFNEERATWVLRLRTAGGPEETLEANAVISAVGQLNRPKLPEIPGMGSFEGPSFHSARWDHRVDLRGKRVAVIGTGASAAQFIPEIAGAVSDLVIFQRTANWFAPVPHYHDDVPPGLRWLHTHVPHYVHWYRFWLFWNTTDGLLPAAIVDENNLGYLPGGPSGVLGFSQAPQQAMPLTANGSPAWQNPSLKTIQSLSDFSLVLIMTEDPDTARTWVEQAGPQLQGKPLMLLLSAQAEPVLRPYLESGSGQVQGMVSGVSGGVAYQDSAVFTLQNDPSGISWSTYSMGLWAGGILLLLAGLYGVFRLAREQENEPSQGDKL